MRNNAGPLSLVTAQRSLPYAWLSCSSRVDLRVGVIKKAWQHKEADSLYVEEVEVGEDTPRQVVSGLVKFIPEAQMQMRQCVLVCNLKPVNMRGVKSHAMVLCATSPDGLKVCCSCGR